MPLGELPLWGQYGLFGLSLSFNIFCAVQWLRGEIVSRRQYEAVQKMSDQWQHAWEVSQQVNAAQAAATSELVTLTATFKHFLESLPPSEDHHVGS